MPRYGVNQAGLVPVGEKSRIHALTPKLGSARGWGSPPSLQLGNPPGSEWKEYQPLRDLLSIGGPEHTGWNDSDRPSQARKAFSAAAAGGFYPHCPSLPGRPPDCREVAVRFPDGRTGGTGLNPSGRFHGQVDIRHAQGASGRHGRDAAPCFLDGTAVPLCRHPGLGSTPAAGCDRHGIRADRIT